MTRPTKDSWNFVKVGEVYQYKEDRLIANVRVLSDTSDNETYRFKLRILQSNIDMESSQIFEISHSKKFEGVYSGMMQLYEDPEYVPLPIGTPWAFNYEEEENDT